MGFVPEQLEEGDPRGSSSSSFTCKNACLLEVAVIILVLVALYYAVARSPVILKL